MSCREFEDAVLLAAYGEDAGRAFAEHAAICPECREETARVRAVRQAYDHTRDERMSAAVRSALRGPRRVSWALAAAALAAIGLAWMLQPAAEKTGRLAPSLSWEHVDRQVDRELGNLEQEIRWHELVLKD